MSKFYSVMEEPDFEKLAIEIVGEGCKPMDHRHDCACGHVQDAMEKIWTDYVTPLQAKIRDLEAEVSRLKEYLR